MIIPLSSDNHPIFPVLTVANHIFPIWSSAPQVMRLLRPHAETQSRRLAARHVAGSDLAGRRGPRGKSLSLHIPPVTKDITY